MTTSLTLSAASRRAFDRLAVDLRRVLDARFVSLVAYSGHESVAFATAVTAGDLDALGVLVEAWHRDGLATPLVMTPDEFERSLDVFPLEYQAILDHHQIVAGDNPFHDAAVDAGDLRRACETHAKGHLIHLRQGWLQAAGHDDRLADLIEHSAAPLRALLTSIARLLGTPAGSADDLAAFAARTMDVPADLVGAVLSLETAPEGRHRLVGRLGEYLAVSQRLWAFVDGWRSA